MRHIRWGDNDRYWGPFTFCFGDYKRLAFSLHSGGQGDDDDGPPSLRISVGSFTFISVLPFMVPPLREKVYPGPASWGPEVIARLGRDWYWKVDPREYGISYWDGFLQIHYGICPGDSSRDQNWCKHLPWTQWRHVRRSLYDLQGRHFWSELDVETRLYQRASTLGRHDLWRERRELIDKWVGMCPTMKFKFRDFDGEEIEATTRLEQREWRFGRGWFEWLSWFRHPKIIGSLCLEFASETGRRKGSWKGGTLGNSITMQPGELHEAAFKRYCAENEMTFVGKSEPGVGLIV
jgi:hypothetical protein